jgi:hypothetical protein
MEVRCVHVFFTFIVLFDILSSVAVLKFWDRHPPIRMLRYFNIAGLHYYVAIS